MSKLKCPKCGAPVKCTRDGKQYDLTFWCGETWTPDGGYYGLCYKQIIEDIQAEEAALRAQFADMQSDYEVGRAIRELPDNYTVTNDGLIARQWEISEWFPKGDHRHFNEITLADCLRAARLLPKEAAK